MKMLIVNGKYFVLLLTILLMAFGTQSSYAQTITASTAEPLTEATLHGSIVTLTLGDGIYERSAWDIRVFVSGIDGVTNRFFDVDRVSDTEVTTELEFTGNMGTDGVLTFTVGAGAIVDYDGNALTATLPVTAVEESLEASTAAPLTEATLHGSVVTLTLTGRQFADEWDIEDALSLSGIDGVTFESWDVERVNDTVVAVPLTFSGNIDTNATLTLTVGADAINYNKDFTFQFPVIALEESLEASTAAPLTEATLRGGTITLTLTGRQFVDETRIAGALSLSGIENVGGLVNRVSDTEATLTLGFFGNIDTDATLTLTVGPSAIAGGYDKDFTFQFPVTAIEESLDASTTFPLTEATLHESVVTLTLTGYRFVDSEWAIEEALSVSGIDGVFVSSSYSAVDRISDTQVAVELEFDSTDFDETDAVLTFTVDADVIVGSEYGLTAQVPVTAIQKSNAAVSIVPSLVVSAAVGDQLTFSLNIAGGENVAGYQATVLLDPTAFDPLDLIALHPVNFTNGDYLPGEVFIADPVFDGYWIKGTSSDEWHRVVSVTIAANTLAGAANGNGTLATLTFKAVDFKASTLILSKVYLVDTAGKLWEAHVENAEITLPPEPAEKILGDINRDGAVNIQDLVIVGARYGLRGQNDADLNGDGLVDIVDLVLVANAFGADAAAPSLNPQILEQLTAADVKGWLNQAQQLSLTDPAYLRGITVLKQLFMALTPKETALLPNYPNPFNPETWIPYHLAKDANVTLHIYAVNGTLVRTLILGHQPAGIYQSRSRAAHWDGKNEFGEPVASGLYFYTLSTESTRDSVTAGDFTATRKMLIRK